MISPRQRQALLTADRTLNLDAIKTAIGEVLTAGQATPLDIEMAFRDAAANSYLIAGETLSVVFGMPAWIAALKEAGITPEQNRDRLGGTNG